MAARLRHLSQRIAEEKAKETGKTGSATIPSSVVGDETQSPGDTSLVEREQEGAS